MNTAQIGGCVHYALVPYRPVTGNEKAFEIGNIISHKPLYQAKLPDGYKAQFLSRAGSTNQTALDMIDQIDPCSDFIPLWITAKQQSEGRGTKGRSWQSDNDNNLYTSLLFYPNCSARRLPQLSLLAGVALYDSLMSLADTPENLASMVLKWPNDVIVGAAKCGGILVETHKKNELPSHFAVIGIGLNIQSAPKVEGRLTTCLYELGIRASANRVLETVAASLDQWVKQWQQGHAFYDIANAWLCRANIMNKLITVRDAEQKIYRGHCIGLTEQGQLIIKQQHNNTRCVFDLFMIEQITA